MSEPETIEPVQSEQAFRAAGQRRVNLIWEFTQAFVAVTVTMATLYVAACLALRGEKDTTAFLLLSNSLFLVVGFYFGRTNHQRTGGIGGADAGAR